MKKIFLLIFSFLLLLGAGCNKNVTPSNVTALPPINNLTTPDDELKNQKNLEQLIKLCDAFKNLLITNPLKNINSSYVATGAECKFFIQTLQQKFGSDTPRTEFSEFSTVCIEIIAQSVKTINLLPQEEKLQQEIMNSSHFCNNTSSLQTKDEIIDAMKTLSTQEQKYSDILTKAENEWESDSQQYKTALDITAAKLGIPLPLNTSDKL